MAGHDQVEFALPSDTKATDALTEIKNAYPGLDRFGRSLLFAVNQAYATADLIVNDGDELAVFPPVSGGSQEAARDGFANDFFEMTTDVIDVGAVARRVVLPECGATVTLDGYAREWTSGRRTLYLIYEAYGPMAQRELERLGREVHEHFKVAHIGIVHRTGRLEIGETSVVITVSAPHRRTAFEACEWAIKELKRTVPIWKKEVFENGEVWVEGETGSDLPKSEGKPTFPT